MAARPLLSIALLPLLFTGYLSAQDEARTGYLIDVPVPLGSQTANELLAKLNRLAESAPEDERLDVVLRYSKDSSGGEATSFEDALKVARAITGDDSLRSIRVISLLETKLTGHSVLPVLASDALLVSADAGLIDASAGDGRVDETVRLSYETIASQRGLFPPPLVRALIDPDKELALVVKVDGGKSLSAGNDLVKLRESGDVLSEEVWSASGVPANVTADQLRSAKIAAGVVATLEEAGEILDLASIAPIEDNLVTGEANGSLLEIAGSISGARVRRWQSNLNGSLTSGDVNTWLIAFDSTGGDIDQTATLASLFALPEPPLRTVVGYVNDQARGDSALAALACKPLYMHPEATIGGEGGDVVTLSDLDNHAELIELVARNTKRPAGLIRGLLCPELEVFRYTNRKTGQVKYTTPEDLVIGVDNPALERDRWEQGERIEFKEALTAARAIELGLADFRSDSLEDVSLRSGLSGTPELISDRGIVRFVERLGRSQGLMMILLMVGFVALSAEMNAPGLGVPGFIALVSFGLFFWMNHLAGTAEWLELILLLLGLVCIFLEIFVIPGFGVFGIGGLIMTIASIVLMSQTFVLPQNSYQLGVITRGIWAALGGVLGLFGGFVLMRQLFPHVPLFKHLIMETPDAVAIDEAEKMADYGWLLNQSGETTTPLRPSGKARFGDDIVQVVSDGAMVEKGVSVKVVEVQGAKVVVEA
ncbi:MAG: NfeD family protein [Planctomycetota bacterium]